MDAHDKSNLDINKNSPRNSIFQDEDSVDTSL